jgi:NO-binding membrane sensor protein with MHYT domain
MHIGGKYCCFIASNGGFCSDTVATSVVIASQMASLILAQLLRNDQGRSKTVITLPLASTALHFVGIQAISVALPTALV